MKNRINAVIGVASGIALTLFALHMSPRLAHWVTASESQRSVALKKSSFRLSEGEMLVMESDSGVAVLELTDFNERSASGPWLQPNG